MRPQRKGPKPSSAIGTAFARVYFGSVVRFLARVTTRSPDASQLMRFSWEMIADRVAPTVILVACIG